MVIVKLYVCTHLQFVFRFLYFKAIAGHILRAKSYCKSHFKILQKVLIQDGIPNKTNR